MALGTKATARTPIPVTGTTTAKTTHRCQVARIPARDNIRTNDHQAIGMATHNMTFRGQKSPDSLVAPFPMQHAQGYLQQYKKAKSIGKRELNGTILVRSSMF